LINYSKVDFSTGESPFDSQWNNVIRTVAKCLKDVFAMCAMARPASAEIERAVRGASPAAAWWRISARDRQHVGHRSRVIPIRA